MYRISAVSGSSAIWKPIPQLPAAASPEAGRLWALHLAASPGKDTTTGHWEMVGIHLAKPFPLSLFPHGFPPEIMREFENRIGRSAARCNCKAASGTEIIAELGEQQAMNTGSPIVYTSADSVYFRSRLMKK